MTIATMKSLLRFTALSAMICTAAYAATAADTSALDALEAKMEAKFGAKIDALQAKVATLENKADNVDASPPLLRRRELWGSWQEVHDELVDKAEKVTQGFRQLYIEENLDDGETVTVYEAGPIKVEAGCGTACESSDDVCLTLTLFNANKDMLVFGDASRDGGLDGSPINDNFLSAGVTYTTELWNVDIDPDGDRFSGNDADDGAVWVDGYYLGVDGESFVGILRPGGLPVIGGNCQIAGVFNYFIPFDKEY